MLPYEEKRKYLTKTEGNFTQKKIKKIARIRRAVF